MKSYAEVVFSSVKEALLFNVIGAVLAVGVLLVIQIPLNESFGFIILIESTGLMLIGGGLGVAGQGTSQKIAEWITRRKLDERELGHSDLVAALYALTGAILFAETFVMAMILA